MSKADSVCAVVVAYFPDQGFCERIHKLLPQLGMLVVVDNTAQENYLHELKSVFDGNTQFELIQNQENLGVAKALNQGLEFAAKRGYKWILTLDQDTRCYSDMVHTLLHIHGVSKPKVAVIGGNYFDPQTQKLKVNAGKKIICIEQKTVITSGSLIDVEAAQAVGGFREDYFIDQVDHEFCLRVRAHGFRVVISQKAVMEHSVGARGGVQLPLLGILPNHPPLRKYYIARNTVVTVKEYWWREPVWCMRRLARLLLGLVFMATLEKQRLVKVRAFLDGFRDGVNGRMGACQRMWLYRL